MIAGATGLVGSACLQLLLDSEKYDHVVAIGRKESGLQHPKLKNIIVDFEQLDNLSPDKPIHDVYCCLGTTIKKAGSPENFRKVDYDFVMNVARWADSHGAKRLMLVSAIGADASSRIFYSKVKGEVERDVAKLNISEIHIFQPSLLLGNRNEFRFGESVGAAMMVLLKPFLRGKLAKYHPIKGADLARAMYAAAFQKKEGIHRYDYPLISLLVKTND